MSGPQERARFQARGGGVDVICGIVCLPSRPYILAGTRKGPLPIDGSGPWRQDYDTYLVGAAPAMTRVALSMARCFLAAASTWDLVTALINEERFWM